MGKRTDEKRLSDRKKIAELYLRGHSQVEIAQQLELTESTVSRDIKAIRKDWQESSLVDFNSALGKQLAEVNRIKQEAWEAWDRSKEPIETSVQSGARGEGATRATIRRQTRTGDKRYMDIIIWCVEHEAKLLGLIQWRGERGSETPVQNTFIIAMADIFGQIARREKGEQPNGPNGNNVLSLPTGGS